MRTAFVTVFVVLLLTASLAAQVDSGHDLQVLSSEKVSCGGSAYRIEKVNNIEHKAFDVRLVNSRGGAKQSIRMPSQDEYGNFALDWAKATKLGFELAISWGTRIHHDMKFSFACRNRRFILVSIKHETFDTHFPEDLRKYRTRKATRPNPPFDKFVISEFLVD